MAIPKYDELYNEILEFLADGAEHSSKEMYDSISDALGLTDEERAEQVPSNTMSRITNHITWARSYLKHAGLITYPKRGTYAITELGRGALSSGKVIDNAYLNQFESFRQFRNRSSAPAAQQEAAAGEYRRRLRATSDESTPDEKLAEALALINRRLADELLDEIMKLSDKAFERFVLDLMGAMGYGAADGSAEQTSFSGDEGIDGIIMEDKLGFDLIYIQVKHYAADHAVGRPEIQAFVGAIAGRNGKGLFVTTSTFSKPARDYAAQQHIVLIDGEKLASLMIEYGFGVSTRKVYKIQALDTDLFNGYLEE